MDFPLLADTPNATISSQNRVWSGRFALDLVTFRHRRFDGTMSGPREWELFRRGTAAGVLPYDPWSDQVVLIEQFRLPALAAGLDPVMTEIPAGLTDDQETPEQTVHREIVEEMNLAADRLAPIASVLLTPGGCDERIALFVGRVHAPPAGPDGLIGQGGLAAEQEDIRIRSYPAATAIRNAIDGLYPNSVTMIALLWLAARRDALRAEWRA